MHGPSQIGSGGATSTERRRWDAYLEALSTTMQYLHQENISELRFDGTGVGDGVDGILMTVGMGNCVHLMTPDQLFHQVTQHDVEKLCSKNPFASL